MKINKVLSLPFSHRKTMYKSNIEGVLWIRIVEEMM